MLVLVALVATGAAGCRRKDVGRTMSGAAVAFERDVLVLKLAHGTRASARVAVTGPRAAETRLVLRSVTHPSVRARVLAPDPAIGVDANAIRDEQGLPVGTHVGNIVVATGLADMPSLTLPYSIRVAGTLDVSPTNPTFNMRDKAAHTRTIVVRSTASEPAAFAVEKVEVPSGPFTATFEKARPGVFHVQVSLLPAELRGDDRGVLGRLVITSNDPAEPIKDIPLFAFGRLNADTKSESDSH